MRNAKLLLVAGVAAVCSVGCSIQMRNGVKEVPYDFSDYAYYDKPFSTSPSYGEVAPEAHAASDASPHGSSVTLASAANAAPGTVEPPSRETPRVYDDTTAVSGTAGVQASRPSKATAFATHAATVLAGERGR